MDQAERRGGGTAAERHGELGVADEARVAVEDDADVTTAHVGDRRVEVVGRAPAPARDRHGDGAVGELDHLDLDRHRDARGVRGIEIDTKTCSPASSTVGSEMDWVKSAGQLKIVQVTAEASQVAGSQPNAAGGEPAASGHSARTVTIDRRGSSRRGMARSVRHGRQIALTTPLLRMG